MTSECDVFPQVHSHLRDIVDSNSSVWARVSFKERWPAPDTLWLFERLDVSKSLCAAVIMLKMTIGLARLEEKQNKAIDYHFFGVKTVK